MTAWTRWLKTRAPKARRRAAARPVRRPLGLVERLEGRDVPSGVSLSLSTATPTYGDKITITAAVSASAPGALDLLLDGTTNIGHIDSISFGFPSFDYADYSHLTVGHHTITATFSSFQENFFGDTVSVDVSRKLLPLLPGGSFFADTKPYDGTTAATVHATNVAIDTSKVLPGDNPVITGFTGSFDGKNAGNHNVALAFTGTGLANYALAYPPLPGHIFPRILTVFNVFAENKVYDGTTAVSLHTDSAALLGALPGETVTLDFSNTTAEIDHPNVGIRNVFYSVIGVHFVNADPANYSVTIYVPPMHVTPRPVSVSGLTAASKVYDGNRTATIRTDSAVFDPTAIVGGDSVSVSSATGLFADKNAGTDKAVTLTGITLTGPDAENYDPVMYGSLTAAITPKPLTVTGITADNKVYDGTPVAAIHTAGAALSGVVTGDTVTAGYAGAVGGFADKNAGTNKAVTVFGITLGGADQGNYAVTPPTATASIAHKPLTASGLSVPASKVYDGTTATAPPIGTAALQAAESPFPFTGPDGRPYIGDAVSLSSSPTASFDSKDVGANKLVTFGGLSLTGADSANYTLTPPTQAAAITPKAVRYGGVSAQSMKVYDGTAKAVVNGTPTLIGSEPPGVGGTSDGRPYSGDVVSLTGTPTGTYNSKDVAAANTITVGGVSLTGPDSGNYSLTPAVFVGVSIGQKPLTVAGLTIPPDRAYDGTTNAAVTGTAALQAAEAAGTGNNADGTPYAGEAVSLTGTPTGTYNSKDVAAANLVAVTGLSLAGADSGNYSLTPLTATAHITRVPLLVTADSASRPYGDPNPVLSASVSGFVGGETLASSGVSGTPGLSTPATAASPVGSYPVVASAGTLAAANYDFTFADGALAVTPRPIAVTADPRSKSYGDADPALTYQITAGSLVNGDGFSGALTRDAGETVAGGPYAIRQGTLGLGGNYALGFTGASLTVSKAAPQFVGLSAPTVIIGTASTTLTGTLSKGGLVPTGAVSVTVNGVTRTAAVGAGGHFSVSVPTRALAAGSYTVGFGYAGDGNFSAASGSSTLAVTYGTSLLFDNTQPAKGDSLKVKVRLTDAGGADVSSPATTVTAVSLVDASGKSQTLKSAGGANPGNAFDYRKGQGGYVFDLDISGLAAGTYTLSYRAAGDPVLHTVQFTVK